MLVIINTVNFFRTIISSGILKKSFTNIISWRMSTSNSRINRIESLKKYEIPVPITESAIAAQNGEIIKLTSIPTVNLLKIDETGNTPLIWCADKGHIDALLFILEAIQKHDPQSINTRGYIGNTALSRAARNGHVECVIALLKMTNINPNIPNDKMQYPIHFAAFNRHREVVKVLLESKKCDSTLTDRKGRTPAEDTSDEVIRQMIIQSRQ